MQASSRFVAPPLQLRGALADSNWSPERLSNFARQLGLHHAAAALLVGRGHFDVSGAENRLQARLGQLRQPRSMAGYDAALDLLVSALAAGRRIGIFGDYDVDGVGTTALLASYLQALGGDVVAHVASRGGGYGLSIGRAQSLVEAGAQAVLTVDCGTSDHDALAWLQERGVPTVVIDHHQVPLEMPPAFALLNPHQPECQFEFKGMCSGGVGFYLCAGLRRRLEPTRNAIPDPRDLLDLVALTTVCDMMTLADNNRIFVRHGLNHLSLRRRPGVAALLRAAGVPANAPIDESHIGFVLGPRLNAPGRLGAATPSLELLMARDEVRAESLAAEIEELNRRRRTHQQQIQAQADFMLQTQGVEHPTALVLQNDAWLPGVVGIAAAGLAQKYQCPTLVLGRDPTSGELRGSARSYGGVDVHRALTACRDLLGRFGGHREAAGLSMLPSALPELRGAFEAAVCEQGLERDHVVEYDGRLRLDQIDDAMLADFRKIGPFGVGFPEPQFLARDVQVRECRKVGGNHLSLRLAAENGRFLPAIAFDAGGAPVRPGDLVDCLFLPQYNDFAGRRTLQLRVLRLWKSTSNPANM